MTDLVTVGETMLRLSPPDDERLETADAYDVRAAGAESNVAVAAQRLGLDSTWTSKLPDTPLGRRVATELRSHGVTVDVSWTDDGRVGTYYFERGRPPRPNDVIYDRAGASVRSATPEDLAMDAVRSATALHTTGITLALADQLRRTTRDVLATASDAGTTTVFDLNYRSKLWTTDEAHEAIDAVLPDVDVTVVARRDAERVLGYDGDSAAIGERLRADYGVDTAVVTRGADGAVGVDETGVVEQPTFGADDAYPVGTGDAFVGGFLARWLRDGDLQEALAYGAATAALKRSIPGDLAVVTPSDVEDVLAGDGPDIDR